MSGLQSLPAAAFATVLAGVLLLRLAFLVWGHPRLPQLLFRAFTAPVSGKRQAVGDAVASGVVLLLLEGLAVSIVARALAQGDYITVVAFTTQIVAAFGWLVFLKRNTG